MAVLVTRPAADNARTVAEVEARGFKALAWPSLKFEALPFHDDPDAHVDGVVVTSANALRAIDDAAKARLIALPLFAVGGQTAEMARQAGFSDVTSADGDASALRELLRSPRVRKKIKKGSTLCYLAGADLAHDLTGELGQDGYNVVTQTTYKMAPVAQLSGEAAQAFNDGTIQAVLHFSRRSGRAFVAAARASGVEISALALRQCCISDAVGSVLRDAGAARVIVASKPDEASVLDALERTLKPKPRM